MLACIHWCDACVIVARYLYAWKSVYPESIFDDAYSLLRQFELDTSSTETAADVGVTVSSSLTFTDTAASAIVAVTLTAMRKVTISGF